MPYLVWTPFPLVTFLKIHLKRKKGQLAKLKHFTKYVILSYNLRKDGSPTHSKSPKTCIEVARRVAGRQLGRFGTQATLNENLIISTRRRIQIIQNTALTKAFSGWGLGPWMGPAALGWPRPRLAPQWPLVAPWPEDPTRIDLKTGDSSASTQISASGSGGGPAVVVLANCGSALTCREQS